jgi:hypothetical protein
MTAYADDGDPLISWAVLRMLAAVPTNPARLSPVAAAELRTTMNDLRTAVNLGRGFAVDELDPASGYPTFDAMYARRFGKAA